MASQGPQRAKFRNEILAALPSSDIEMLRPHLTQVSLTLKQVLHERGSRIANVFFMESGVASLTANTSDGAQVEVGLTGREGFVGASVVLNPTATAVHKAFIQADGSAFRIGAARLRAGMVQSESLRDHCLRYVDRLMAQTSQLAACNARHSVPQRLARWLLMMRDRMEANDLPITQEFLSIMLGVRRAGVSLAATTLQAGGLIQYSRGHVKVLDHEGLAAAACGCYLIIQGTGKRPRVASQPRHQVLRCSRSARVRV
jgi:CRP-like cAMP-binding protein